MFEIFPLFFIPSVFLCDLSSNRLIIFLSLLISVARSFEMFIIFQIFELSFGVSFITAGSVKSYMRHLCPSLQDVLIILEFECFDKFSLGVPNCFAKHYILSERKFPCVWYLTRLRVSPFV